jgi:hypothetical protein
MFRERLHRSLLPSGITGPSYLRNQSTEPSAGGQCGITAANVESAVICRSAKIKPTALHCSAMY